MHSSKTLLVFLLALCLIGLMGSHSVLMASHATHFLDAKGPGLPADESDGCYVCHCNGRLQCQDAPVFADFEPLATTNVCDPCHSPGGAFDGVDDVVIGAKANWDDGVYDGDTLQTGKEGWCAGCHDDDPDTPGTNESAFIDGVYAPGIAGDNTSYGFYVSGHGRSATVGCLDCHDSTVTHADGEARTYGYDYAYYDAGESGVAYASGYRLRYVSGDVPLMIPANYGTTFSYDAGLMKNTAFRLCFGCHDSGKILDDTPGPPEGITSNLKCSFPNPPKDYSYACGSGADVNEHVAHIMNYIGPFWDSDWDTDTTGTGGSNGRDSMTACSSCHNVHGAAGAEDSTSEAMIRDGSLAGRTGYGFSYVIEDTGAGGYPMVTSTDATQANSVGSVFRNNTSNMCGGSMCHGNPDPPAGGSYDASGSGWGTYLEYYRPWTDYGHLLP